MQNFFQLRAWKDKDYGALDRLLSDDYRAVNFHGIVKQTKSPLQKKTAIMPICKAT